MRLDSAAPISPYNNLKYMLKLLLKIGDVVTNEFPLDKAQFSIGRNSDNDIVLDDPLVSGHHANLTITWPTPTQPGQYSILYQDLNSTNGSRINGMDVRRSTLKHGDTVNIGRNVLSVYDDTMGKPTTSQN